MTPGILKRFVCLFKGHDLIPMLICDSGISVSRGGTCTITNVLHQCSRCSYKEGAGATLTFHGDVHVCTGFSVWSPKPIAFHGDLNNDRT